MNAMHGHHYALIDCMEDKFELVEDFKSARRPKRSKSKAQKEERESRGSPADWKPQYYDSSEHPLSYMVRCLGCFPKVQRVPKIFTSYLPTAQETI